MTDVVRPGEPQDSVPCAGILNAWIDATVWMPRVHPADDVVRHYRDTVFAKREIYVIGRPPRAYVALDENDFVTSLYAATPGNGLGKTLIDHAKKLRPRLSLWTFVANTDAQRFYAREGFREIDRSDGDNEEHLPDILYRWEAA